MIIFDQGVHIRCFWPLQTFAHKWCPCADTNRWTKARGFKLSKRASVWSPRTQRSVKRQETKIWRDSKQWVKITHSLRHAITSLSLSAAWQLLTVSAGWMRLMLCIKVNPTRNPIKPSYPIHKIGSTLNPLIEGTGEVPLFCTVCPFLKLITWEAYS